jgi:hypothetical protein
MWTEMPVDVVLEAECGGYDAEQTGELEEQSGEAGLKGGLGGRREVQLDWRVRSEMSVIDEAARSVAAKKKCSVSVGKGGCSQRKQDLREDPRPPSQSPQDTPQPVLVRRGCQGGSGSWWLEASAIKRARRLGCWWMEKEEERWRRWEGTA